MTDAEIKMWCAVKEADEKFGVDSAGGTKTWIRDYLAPAMEKRNVLPAGTTPPRRRREGGMMKTATMLGPWANTEEEIKTLRAEIDRLIEVIQWAGIYGRFSSGGVDHDDWEDELRRRMNAAIRAKK